MKSVRNQGSRLSRVTRRLKAIRLIDESFLKAPGKYILQSLLAVSAMMIILHFLGFLTRAAIVAALGSSTFIVFTMPNSVSAQPKRLIGGHVVGLLCGLLGYYIFVGGPLGERFENTERILWFAMALSIGLSVFLMTITNTEHPPAAGTAIGIVAYDWSEQTIIFVVIFAISLSIVKRLLSRFLVDLV